MEYRREIDGLRALAVLPVILFHAGFETFSGGFVGVDVFFVISGYLITTIILGELEQGTFSIVNFYERRARRILPALFLVMLVCIPFAWCWLLPRDLKEFSQSLVAVSVFVSNISFWLESGYFNTANELKPLLHTWSLAVEEQYYVLFPLLLIALWRFGKQWIVILLSLAGIASLGLAQWASIVKPTPAFYLLPTRGWELVIGASAAFYMSRVNRIEFSRGVAEASGWLGFVLLLYSVFTYSKFTPFPGLYALAPTVGAVLIILFATQQTTIGKFVGNKAFVSIGLISYSAYLWHQPLFAFARHQSLNKPSHLVFAVLSCSSLVLAYFSWRYVESRFRNRLFIPRSRLFLAAFLATLCFVGIGLVGMTNDGFKSRFHIPSSVYDSIKRTSRAADCFGKDGIHTIDDWYCEIGQEADKKDLVVFGDSHVLSALPAVDAVSKRLGLSGVFVGASACTPFLDIYVLRHDQLSHNCHLLNKRVFDYVKTHHVSTVLLVARWTFYTDGGYGGDDFAFISTKGNGDRNKVESRKAFEAGLKATVTAYRDLGVKLIVMSQVPQQRAAPIKIYAQSGLFGDRAVNTFSVKREDHMSLQRYVRDVFDKEAVEVIDIDEVFCDETWCAVGDNSTSYYYDDDHLSLEGSKKLEAPLSKVLRER
jgi:peptidoglycan/LPS O-acetylase OafA/YrhL